MAGGGAAPPLKQEELQPHPVKDQLPSVSYCITSPPPWRTSLSPTYLGLLSSMSLACHVCSDVCTSAFMFLSFGSSPLMSMLSCLELGTGSGLLLISGYPL